MSVPRCSDATYDGAVQRSNIMTADGESWQALVLDVGRPRRASLQVQIAGRRQLLLRQDAEAVLLARTRPCRRDVVDYLRTDRYRSPVPPIRAAHARMVATGDTGSTLSRWAHHFASELAGTDLGPLQSGRWIISGDSDPQWGLHKTYYTAQRWELLSGDPEGFICWWPTYGGGQVLPLRQLSDAGDSRVKAYRKQARDGSLPPILVWWISGLDSFVLLDGHDRFRAAILEGRQPPILALSSLSPEQNQWYVEAYIARYAQAMPHIRRQAEARVAGAEAALANAHRKLGEDVHACGIHCAPTPAWPLRGGLAAWRDAVRLHTSSPPAWTEAADAPSTNGKHPAVIAAS